MAAMDRVEAAVRDERPQPAAASNRSGRARFPHPSHSGAVRRSVASSPEETAMSDKSPHATHSAKKSGKTLKAKRVERREKQQSEAQLQRLMHPRKTGS
jgi:hypothetical protein